MAVPMLLVHATCLLLLRARMHSVAVLKHPALQPVCMESCARMRILYPARSLFQPPEVAMCLDCLVSGPCG